MTAVLQQQPEERNADRQTSGWCKGENERAFESDTYSLPQKGAVPRGRKVTFGCQTGLCSRETAEIQPPAPGETSKHKLHSTRLDFAKVFLHRHSRVRTRSCATHRLNMSEQPPLSAAGPKPSSSLLGRLANVSLGKAAAWVFGIWAAYTGLFWGLGQAAQLVSKRMTGS